MRSRSTFAALRVRDFRVFWAGFFISDVGVWMQTFALGWLVVQLAVRDGPDRAPLYLGLVGLARAVPSIPMTLVSGVLVDRVERRRLLLVTDAVAAVIAVLLAALTLTEQITIAWVIALAMLGQLTRSLEVLVRQALLPRLVSGADLVSAVGLNSTGVNLSAMVGPLLGGILIGPIGIGGLMVLNCLSYLAIIVAVSAVPAIAPQAASVGGGMLRTLTEGLRYVRDDGFMRWQILLFASAAILGRPYADLLPAFVHDTLRLGAVELSWLAAAGSAGGLAATFLIPRVGTSRHAGTIFGVATVLGGASLVVLSLQRDLVPAIVAMVAVAFTLILGATLSMTLLQLRAPDRLRGRVFSVQNVMVSTGMPLGTMLLGTLGSFLSIEVAIALAGMTLTVIAASVLVRAAPLRTPGRASGRGPVEAFDPVKGTDVREV